MRLTRFFKLLCIYRVALAAALYILCLSGYWSYLDLAALTGTDVFNVPRAERNALDEAHPYIDIMINLHQLNPTLCSDTIMYHILQNNSEDLLLVMWL